MPEGPHSEAAAVAVSANNRCSLPRTASTSALPSDALCEDSCPAESFFPSMENEDESPGYMDEPRLSIAELAAKFKAMLRIEKKYLVRGDGGRESPTNNQYGFSEKVSCKASMRLPLTVCLIGRSIASPILVA